LVGLGVIQAPRYWIVGQISSDLLNVVLESNPQPDMAALILYFDSWQMLPPRVCVCVEWFAEHSDQRRTPVAAD
jgi:hypothetical protein